MSEGTLQSKPQSQRASKGMSMDRPTLARYAFIAGIVLAAIIALVTDLDDWVIWLMALLGLYAGWEFVSEDQEHHFFLVGISLVFLSQTLADTLGNFPSIGEILLGLLTSLAIFFGFMIISVIVRNIVRWVSTT
jgi:hypothetical protein